MASADAQIALHADGAVRLVPRTQVYFAFASGRFSYDCVKCGSKCCRGYGFNAVLTHELTPLLSTKRFLPLFIDEGWTPHSRERTVLNLPPSCYFLRDDGRCQVHEERGYDAKPETCRLFPFNAIQTVGDYLVVGMHRGLCPLDIVPPRNSSAASDHEALLNEMSSRGISHTEHATAAASKLTDVIALERRIVDMSESYLDTADWTGFLHAQVRESHVDSLEHDRVLESLSHVERYLHALLGAPPSSVAPEGPNRTMIACTPHLRALLLFQSPRLGSGRGVPPDRTRIHQSLACTFYLAAAAHGTGMPQFTYQSLSELEKALRPLVEMLAQTDRVLTWQRDAPIELVGVASRHRSALLDVFVALLPSRQRRRCAALGDILLEHAPSDPVDRVVFLKSVARRVAGRVVVLEHYRENRYPASRRARAARVLQRFVMGASDEVTRLALYSRLAALGSA